MLEFIHKNLDKIITFVGYAMVLTMWASFTSMIWINCENYESDPFGSLAVAILGPPIILFLGAVVLWIMSLRFDTRMNALGKIGTDESWDFFETLEMFQMFSDWD